MTRHDALDRHALRAAGPAALLRREGVAFASPQVEAARALVRSGGAVPTLREVMVRGGG